MMILVLLLALLVTATTVALLRAISSDGYATRPAPRSHVDPFDPHHRLV